MNLLASIRNIFLPLFHNAGQEAHRNQFMLKDKVLYGFGCA